MNLLPEIQLNIPIKEIILQEGIADNATDYLEYADKALLINDENTKNFVKLGCKTITLQANQKPTLEKAQELAKEACNYFIAVGSGSLNDVVKYAAALSGKHYISFPTALSMNGYASGNASLLDKGYKQSFKAAPPSAIYMDLEILKNAPRKLNASGVGDSICRSVVQADTLLSQQALNTPNYQELFELLKRYENDIASDIVALAKTLIFGGIAMYVAGSSAPASQGEHMLAHYMELMDTKAPHSYHGEQIAITTLSMAALQEKLLNKLGNEFEVAPADPNIIEKHFGPELAAQFIEQTQKKYSKLPKKIKLDKSKIESALVKAGNIRARLKSIGAPLEAADIGWDKSIYLAAQKYSRYTRDRFTFLDLIDLA